MPSCQLGVWDAPPKCSRTEVTRIRAARVSLWYLSLDEIACGVWHALRRYKGSEEEGWREWGREGEGGRAFVLASVLLSEIHLYNLISCSLLQLTLRVLTWFDSESSCALYEVR